MRLTRAALIALGAGTLGLGALAAGGAADAEEAPGPGAALYEKGAGATAVLADGRVRVPAASFACAGCHGADGEGGREGGVEFPPVVWEALTDPLRPDGGYDVKTLARAVTLGEAPDGRALSTKMPRFEADDAVLTDLAAYLGDLSWRARRGVTAREVRLAAPSEHGERLAFEAALGEANEAGGAWGRRFVIADEGPAILTADEARTPVGAALDRAVRGTVVAFLSRQRIGAVSLTSADASWTDALRDAGIVLREDAATLLVIGPGETPAAGRFDRVIAMPDALDTTEATERVTLLSGTARPVAETYLAGQVAADAALACGRDLTRACLLRTIDRPDLSRWVSIEPAGAADRR
ncbi:c-type cytochrome [Acuticoccus sediminis]|uniref:c-type cytochrome n=1 Tax=Acuticoccus sediminis TaxID=2184697 RepID=UPI001CFCB2BB|nr:c-type cytochrome [Acuticoccus sediminis]